MGKVPTASCQSMRLWRRRAEGTQVTEAKIPTTREGQKDLCARTNSSPVSASKLKSYPPELGMVVGAHILCVHNRALLSSCLAQPKRGRETAAAPMPLPPRASSKVFQNLGSPHPFTLTQRPKVTEEAPTPPGRVKYPMNCPFPNKHGVG